MSQVLSDYHGKGITVAAPPRPVPSPPETLRADKLGPKYIVQKSDGAPIDPDAEYFVLRIDTDPAARYAVLEYAWYIRQSDPALASALFAWVEPYRHTGRTLVQKEKPNMWYLQNSEAFQTWQAEHGLPNYIPPPEKFPCYASLHVTNWGYQEQMPQYFYAADLAAMLLKLEALPSQETP